MNTAGDPAAEVRWLLEERLPPLRRTVEAALEAAFDIGEDCPSVLRESMRYSTLAGGKRLRPMLVLLACEACGGGIESALPAAVAIEMVHTYSLIHDDLPAMDDDDLRRGQPTNHVKFGEATAILAGDGLLTLAFEQLVQVEPAAAAIGCCRDLAEGAGPAGMVGGQQADLEAETNGISSVEHLEAIHRRKTGRLICAALRMGGRIAGASDEMLRGLTTYGQRIGLAFQIADDLLDVTSTAEKMGKGVGKDASRNKLTYPSLLGLEESRRRAELLVAEAIGALDPVRPRARSLVALAHYVIFRDA